MSLSRIRNIKNDTLTWPGFVDALAALLMVVIFVLMIFSIAQFYLCLLYTSPSPRDQRGSRMPSYS